MTRAFRALFAGLLVGFCSCLLAQGSGYTNAWVKYADDHSTAYSIDSNSIVRNRAGNYYVLVMMRPYNGNIFNQQLRRSDVVYVYSEMELDVTNQRVRALSMRAFDKSGREVVTDTYAPNEPLPPFDPIPPGSVTDSLRRYVVDHRR